MLDRLERAALIAAISCGGAVAVPAVASEGALQGAWTMVGTECSETFDLSGGTAKFRDRGASVSTGIIVRGDRFEGPISTCSIGRISQNGDVYKVRLGCASSIMFSDVTVSLSLLDPEHFRRFDPDFPEVSVDYQKCSP
jgi:hypothetical protein